MSVVERNSSIESKSQSDDDKAEKKDVRVGPDFQVSIPDFSEAKPDNYFNEPSEQEVKVWNRQLSAPSHDMESYLAEAKKLSYPTDSALSLLHYHNYNTQHAIDDLPNYEPMLNKYTPSDVKRFLRIVGGRRVKDFAKISREFPEYTMGEIQSLYYAIGIPFKARLRRGSDYHLKMRKFYEKALKLGFIENHLPSEFRQYGNDPDEVVADSDFEGYSHKITPADESRKLCRSVIRGRPCVGKVNGNGIGARSLVDTSKDVAANGALASNQPEIYPESHHRVAHNERKDETNRLEEFNVNDFSGFTSFSESGEKDEEAKSNDKFVKLDEYLKKLFEETGSTSDFSGFSSFSWSGDEDEETKSNDELVKLDGDLKQSAEEIGTTNEGTFNAINSLHSRSGAENVTFRWTESELAIFVMALDTHGRDFAQIAQVMATKTESMIRDFYNKYNERFGLDAFIDREDKEIKEENIGDKAVTRRSSNSAETTETPYRQGKLSKPPTSEELPARRPRGRPPLKKSVATIQESSPVDGLSIGAKGDECSMPSKTKTKESPEAGSKRKLSINPQEASEVPKKRGRESSLSPRSSHLRR